MRLCKLNIIITFSDCDDFRSVMLINVYSRNELIQFNLRTIFVYKS